MAYSEKVIAHYENPHNVGAFGTTKDVKARKDIGVGVVGAPECGDVMQIQIQVDEASGTIRDAKFKCFGCGSAIASSSLATEWIKGKSIDEALQIKNTDIVQELSLPPVKIHCSVLAEDSIRAAIKDWQTKNGKTADASAHAHAGH
ncbi:MAG: iron-sulfur cluster assembly scaffold protein [Phycisphaerales bacterium]